LILNHPALLKQHDEEFSRLRLTNPELDRLRNAILHEAARNSDLDSEGLKLHLTQQGFADALSTVGGRKATDRLWLYWFVQPEVALEDAEQGWKQILARHFKADMQTELKLAEDALAADLTEENFRRVQLLKKQIGLGEGDEAELDGFGVASGREAAI
jgi:DNA primase